MLKPGWIDIEASLEPDQMTGVGECVKLPSANASLTEGGCANNTGLRCDKLLDHLHAPRQVLHHLSVLEKAKADI